MTDTVRSTPKDVFLHLLSTITLYMSVYAILALLFSCINVAFPDPLSYSYNGYNSGELDTIRFSIAMLVVALPITMLLTVLINRDIVRIPEKADIDARRWLTYLTVFLAAVMIIIDVITLVYNFLNGELSIRFYLKVVVIFVVAAAVFGYELIDIRRSGAFESKRTRAIGIAAIAAMIVSIAVSFLVAGSPWYQRSVRFDESRSNDLGLIQSQIIQYWSQKGALPTTLEDLTDSISGFTAPVDPQSGKNYEYALTEKQTFTLCADFTTKSNQKMDQKLAYTETNFWQHDAGRTCFDRTIDPQLYPVNDGVKPVPSMR